MSAETKIQTKPNLPLILAWHVLTAMLVVLAASYFIRVPPWFMKSDELFFVGIFFAAYLISTLLPTIGNLRSGQPRLWLSALVAIAIIGGTYLALDQMDYTYQNRTVARAALSSLAITLLMLPLFKQGALRQKIGSVLIAVVVAAWAISLTGSDMLFKYQSDRIERAYLSTAYYNVSMRRYWRAFHNVDVKGGGITTLGDKFLIATGDGYLYLFDFDNDSEIRSENLGLLAPFNATKFAEDAPDDIKTRRFRVAGIASQPAADGRYEIYLAHHYWLAEQQCFVVRVSRTIASHATLSAAASEGLEWETVYESSPCLPIMSEGEPFFLGMESGGAMVFIDTDTMLLTLGDQAFDGVDGIPAIAQDSNYDYGKTILINLRSGDARHYTIGHRNPQGLHIGDDGRIWALEHGPQGGDELNLLEDGIDYGWPSVTYGTDYGSNTWPLTVVQGRHDGYAEPIYAWVPSRATSPLTQVKNDLFRWWQGDLLAGSLGARTIYRIRLKDDRVVLVEPIRIDSPVRDIVEGPDGRLVIWTEGAVILLEPLTDEDIGADNPALLFASSCSGCHKINDGKTHGIGPDLKGVAGRKIGSAEGFDYSDILSIADGNWTRDRLDEFLSDPQAYAPGTAMQMAPITDTAKRKALVDYLYSNP